MKEVYIIGGGACGVSTALNLAINNDEVNITILEKNERILKKVLATGNGRCNIGNTNLEASFYNNQELINELFKQVDIDYYINFFNRMGLFTKTLDQGRIYPYSENASTVVDILLRELRNKKIKILTSCEVVRLQKKGKFIITTADKRQFAADKVVISTGSYSWVKKANGYKMLETLNHHIMNTQPSLVGLKVNEKVDDLQGIRCKANVSLLKSKEDIFHEYGEVLFKKEGLSGIVIMNISRMVLFDHVDDYKIKLDLLPNLTKSEIMSKIDGRHLSELEVLYGLLPKAIVNKFKNQEDIINYCKNITFSICGNYGFDNSQITKGGVDTSEINYETFESRIIKDLYIGGEILDVDAMCGGYNLFFAFASGIVIGKKMFTKA